MAKKTVTIKMNERLHEQAKALCKKYEISFSAAVELFLYDAINNEKKFAEKTESSYENDMKEKRKKFSLFFDDKQE